MSTIGHWLENASLKPRTVTYLGYLQLGDVILLDVSRV